MGSEYTYTDLDADTDSQPSVAFCHCTAVYFYPNTLPNFCAVSVYYSPSDFYPDAV